MNYKHLQYFQAVAETGSISKAARKLDLTPQTVSHQLGLLEEQLGTRLLERKGHQWNVTDSGAIALKYASEIFSLGQEMQDALRGAQSDAPMHLHVGITDAIPKHVAYRLIEPVLEKSIPMTFTCVEGNIRDLSQQLEAHSIDVILTDRPLTPDILARAESYFLYESQLSIMAHKKLVSELPFPESLNKLPFLLLSEHHHLAHALIEWFDQHHLSPRIMGRFDDSALMKTFAKNGVGACCIPTLIEGDVAEEFGLHCIGHITTVTEKYYAIKMQRKVEHPGVTAICSFSANL